MVAQLQSPPMSPEEYLEWELKQPFKYGYIKGRIYAMSGGTLAHDRVAVNLTALLVPHLRGGPCINYGSDAKVGITARGPFHYPDASITCDERDKSASIVIRHPCLIVEVLSDSTEAFDRGEKFMHYRRIKTLREYVLISPKSMSVECHRLNEQGKWELTHYFLDSQRENDPCEVELTSVGLSFPIEALYESVSLPSSEASSDDTNNTLST